jgi:hypothetical protein
LSRGGSTSTIAIISWSYAKHACGSAFFWQSLVDFVTSLFDSSKRTADKGRPFLVSRLDISNLCWSFAHIPHQNQLNYAEF